MATFKTQIEDMTGDVGDDGALTQWLTDGAKELINILPPKLKEKCVSATGVGTDFKVDLDGLGEILYVTRENADSGFLVPCREIPSMYGGLAFSGSGDMMYEPSITDPVYWIDGDTSGAATLYVKPTPTANQPAIVHHVKYPANSATWGDSANALPTVSTSIPNFPDEAEYLVVLYACIKAIQYQMITLQTNSAIDTTAIGAIKTELDKVDNIIVEASDKIDAYYTSIGDIDNTTDLWDDTIKRFVYVRDALLKAQTLVDGATIGGDTEPESIQYWLNDEDPEMVQATISAANLELSRASSSINEINGIIASYKIELDGVPLYLQEAASYINQAQGYIGEVKTRMERDAQKYQ